MAQERLTFEADEFNGSDPLAKTFGLSEAPPVLLRCINELDAQANAEIELTDGLDTAFEYPVLAGEFTMLGGTGTPADAAGQAASDLLGEPWERIRVTVVPAEAPTSGHLTVRTATDEG